jgi:threonine aldolase
MMIRRKFLKLSSTAALLPALSFSASMPEDTLPVLKEAVYLTGDGLNLTPAAYTQLLQQLMAREQSSADNYSQGGSVEHLEKKMAEILGKEAAIFMPTGTLANQLAIRTLASGNSRAIVQEESHVYNDTGDACQVLSNLNLLPLGAGKATFTLAEVKSILNKTAKGRVAANVGVLSIESPVRRKTGEVFDYEEMKKICAYARENNIKTHLDGARIFLAAPYTGVSVKEYAALFDTVYVSLYKYFNAVSGAILAGDQKLIGPLFHQRRMFGSGLHQAWPFTAVAAYYVDGFTERYSKAVSISEDFIKRIDNHSGFEVQRIPSGSNIFRIKILGGNIKAFIDSLKANGIIVSADTTLENTLLCQVNESLLNTNAADLAAVFHKSIKN